MISKTLAALRRSHDAQRRAEENAVAVQAQAEADRLEAAFDAMTDQFRPDITETVDQLLRPDMPVRGSMIGHSTPAGEPTRARKHQWDAGLDLYAAESAWLARGQVVKVGTGISVAIPEACVGLVVLRSSAGAKGIQLANSVGVIDAGYRGEISLLLTVIGEDYRVQVGDRIAQLLVLPCLLPTPVFVDDLPESGDGRGTGGFGSTG